MAQALVIAGPVGAGKTSDRHGERVAEAGLAALWPVYRNEGIERLLLARVIEKPSHLELVRRAVPEARIQVAWLEVPPETMAERLREREIGSALDWHLARSEEIRRNAAQHDLFDFAVEGGRPVREVALEVLERADWIASVLPDR